MSTSPTARDPRLATIVAALRTAMHDSPDSAFVLDLTGVLLMANDRLCSSLGVDESALLGRHFDTASRSTDPARVAESFQSACAGTASRYRASGTRDNGDAFVAEVTQLPIRIDDAVVAVFGTAVDLTIADAHDAEARRSEELLRLAGRIARFGGWSLDADSREVTLSVGALELLGIPDDHADVTATVWALHAPDDRALVSASLERCVSTGESFDIETVIYTTLGERLTVRTIGEADRRPDGRIVGARGAFLDVSDAVSASGRERAIEAQLNAALNTITDGIFFLDREGRVGFVNSHATEMLRRTEADVMNVPLWTLLPETVNAGFHDSFVRAAETGERQVYRAYFAAYESWFETTTYPSNDGFAVYLRNVTGDEESRAAARRQQEQLAQQSALLDNARDAMVVRDLDNRVQYWNHAAAELYGWTAEEALGQPIGDLIYGDDVALRNATELVLRDGHFTGELEQRGRDGRTIIADCRWQLLTDDDNTPRSIFAINTDITEYRQEQESRLRAQRMESLGTLAGGIAHDLNNVLTPILMSAQLLGLDEIRADRREVLATIESAVKRGSELIRQVLSFARGVEGRRVAVDVDRLIDDLVAFSRDMTPHGVSVDVLRDANLPLTVGDPTQLLQVLVNLVTNAADAMVDGGRLRISAGQTDIDEECPSVSHTVAPGSYVTIEVEDDGYGISAEMISRIFEPFFTTKAVGKGTGLGLATSLAIVRSHGGFMQVYSEPQRGTRFIVGLPISSTAVRPVAPMPAVPALLPTGDGELILVIDDDESIRRVTSRTLEAHGYRTVTASNGHEGIELIERGRERIDLVVTDMMMPVMDGAATSAYLEEHHPGIPIIGASGLTSGASSSRAIGMGISRFLAKPYTTSVLLTTVRDTLLEHRSRVKEAP